MLILFLFTVNVWDLDKAKMDGRVDDFKSLLKKWESTQKIDCSSVNNLPAIVTSHRLIPNSLNWGIDITVDSAYKYQSLSMDCTNGNILFIASSCQRSCNDTFHIDVHYSTDGGEHWSWFATLGLNGYPYDLLNPSTKIVESDDTTYLFIAYEGRLIFNPQDGFIGIWRFNFESWEDTSFFISNVSGLDELHPCLEVDDIQYPYAPYLYCVWESADSIIFARSVNRGKNWIDRVNLKSATSTVKFRNPRCAYGWYSQNDSITIGVCFERHIINSNRKSIFYALNWAFGNSFGWNFQGNFPNLYNCSEYLPQISMAHHTSGMVIFFTRTDTILMRNRLVCKYTFDGYQWQEAIIDSNANLIGIPSTIIVDDSCGFYHLFFIDGDNIKYSNAPYDNLSTPYWSSPFRINENIVNDSIIPGSVVLSYLPAVCWIEDGIGCKYIKFDGIWANSIRENSSFVRLPDIRISPNPAKRFITIQFSSQQRGPIQIKVYSATGGLNCIKAFNDITASAGNIKINIVHLPSGVYFLQIKNQNMEVIKKLVLVK